MLTPIERHAINEAIKTQRGNLESELFLARRRLNIAQIERIEEKLKTLALAQIKIQTVNYGQG